MKILSPSMHAYVDYLIVLFLWTAPTTFIMPDDLGRIAYAMGLAHLFFTVCTDTNATIFRFFSMPLHGLIELFVSILIVTLCYTWLRYDDRSRAFLLTYAVILLVMFVVTDYTDSEAAKMVRRPKGSAPLTDPNTAA
ncbi:hypothetical protein [Mucilaginibacter pedocola]|uniref:Uncharacterized protein n=1 Tax=Mucilaginibacter pedocola TaxID=1792845 RepID=A0A1S9PI65_9SPHI|nr:hypothetical protein [Mucilaginibacter pedocola]OOQ60639.1 hypothetical protein BC343_23875 [Mucilaginibacter pedocola]